MADIFVSYARSTAAQAQQIAEALRGLGYGVWRDDELPAHRAYAEVIEERLAAAKAVVVIWSAEAVKSEWVQSEADRARADRKLVQLTLDGAPLPMPFDRIQCADLSGWTGDLNAAGWRKVVASIADLLGPAASAPAVGAENSRGVSVCVLPFANMSGDAEQEYFADGISEDIITDLSKVSALSVIARNTAFTFKGRHVDVPEVARQLNVTHVLEGSVRKAGNRVRITAQLIDGKAGDHVWAERYDRDLDDIFALQDEISEAIVTALKLKLFPAEKKAIEDRGTTNVEAYDLFLRARALARTYSPTEILRAIEIYRQALALDPDFAPAWAGLAVALSRALINSAGDRTQTLKDREEAFDRALALAPDAWTTQLSLAGQLSARRDWAGAEQAYARAMALAPASEPSVLSGLGLLLANVGRMREALEPVRAALRAEPLSLDASIFVQIQFDNVFDHAEAQAEYERSKDLAGDRGIAEWWALKRSWWRGEDVARIRQRFAHYLTYESLVMPVFRDLIEVLDDPAAALALVRSVHDDPTYQDPSRQNILSCLAAHYGDHDLALAALLRSVVDLSATTIMWIWEPQFAELRKGPGFKAVLRDLGLVDYWSSSGKWGDYVRPLGADDFEVIG